MNAASMHLESNASSWRLVMVAVLGAGAAFFWHPLALLLLACLLAVLIPTNDFKWFFLVAVCVLFTILNVSKEMEGDLVTYVGLQDYIKTQPFWTLFNKEDLRLVSGTYRATELGFYLPLWLMGQVITDSKTALVMYATLGIYVPTFLALLLIGRSENWSRGLVLTVALFSFFAGINFIASTHLIRQYISAAVLFYAFALLLAGRNRWALFVALYACAVHNGTGLLIPVVAAACWTFRRREGTKLGFVGFFFRIVGLGALLALTMVLVPILQGVSLKEDVPNLKAWHFLIVGAFFLVAHAAIQIERIRLASIYYARIAFLAIYILSLGFFLLGIPLFALRYFAYLEWIYGLMLGAIMFGLFRNRPALQVFCRFAVCLAASAILIARITASEWLYGPGDNYLLSWDFFQVTQLVAR